MEHHQFQIFWSAPAKQDFEKINAQIAENSPLNAARFGEKMLQALDALRWRPKRFPALYETPVCRYLLFKKYRVACKRGDQKVAVE